MTYKKLLIDTVKENYKDATVIRGLDNWVLKQFKELNLKIDLNRVIMIISDYVDEGALGECLGVRVKEGKHAAVVALSKKRVKGGKLSIRNKGVLIHELVHASQFQYGDFDMLVDEDDLYTYYERPSEIEAFGMEDSYLAKTLKKLNFLGKGLYYLGMI